MEIPRKVQLTGRNTFIVSLPHEWVAKRSVSKGDAVYLSESSDGSLVLSLSEARKELKTVSIEVTSESSEIAMRNVVSAYVGGAGRIVLKGTGTNTIAEEARRVLSGIEIAEEDGNALTLRILAFDDLQIDNVIKRAYNVTMNMFDLGIRFFREGGEVLTEISRKEDEVDRLYLLLLRNVTIGRYLGKESVFKVISAKSIEKVSDHMEEICTYGKAHAPNALIAGLLEKSAKMYSVAFQSLSKAELDRGEFAAAKRAYLADYEKVDGILKKEKDASRMLALRSLAEKCNKVLRYSEDIMESSSDLAFAQMEGAGMEEL
jgi:phosphate uptake regulator